MNTSSTTELKPGTPEFNAALHAHLFGENEQEYAKRPAPTAGKVIFNACKYVALATLSAAITWLAIWYSEGGDCYFYSL